MMSWGSNWRMQKNPLYRTIFPQGMRILTERDIQILVVPCEQTPSSWLYANPVSSSGRHRY